MVNIQRVTLSSAGYYSGSICSPPKSSETGINDTAVPNIFPDVLDKLSMVALIMRLALSADLIAALLFDTEKSSNPIPKYYKTADNNGGRDIRQ